MSIDWSKFKNAVVACWGVAKEPIEEMAKAAYRGVTAPLVADPRKIVGALPERLRAQAQALLADDGNRAVVSGLLAHVVAQGEGILERINPADAPS